MAPKSDISLFTVTLRLLILSLFSFVSNATANSSPFEFLEPLKGCRKGDNVKGITDLKKYLHKFGYLDYKNIQHDDDDFDEHLEEAVKRYQLNFHLDSTGTLDDKTMSTMMMPRCGVPDIINGTTSSIHFAFPNGKPKWPPNKYTLSYALLPGTPSQGMEAVPRAFDTWAKNTHFKFNKVPNYDQADLKVSFQKRDHGDGNAFDGPGGKLAHAFFPPDGRFHIDAEESWSLVAKPGTYDMESIAVHEIGHLLGLSHSSVAGATMAPSIAPGATVRGLHADDIAGIKALYGT